MRTHRTAARPGSRNRRFNTYLLTILTIAASEMFLFGQATPPTSPGKTPAPSTPSATASPTPGAAAPSAPSAAAPGTPTASAPATPGASAPATPVASAPGATNTPAPPPAAGAERSEADLDKLVGTIALFPDPLLATLLPAS